MRRGGRLGLSEQRGASFPLLFIFGAPRSGTSWLAKIFDSHPDVIYRHEPDSQVRHADIPYLCSADDNERLRGAAHTYLSDLLRVRTLKSAGSLPVFPKNYHDQARHYLRTGVIAAIRVAEKLGARRLAAEKLQIPDMLRPGASPYVVMKSVSALGRARLFRDAMPASKIILIVRHPCGQVSSTLRGMATNKLSKYVPVAAMSVTPQAQRRGLTHDKLEGMEVVEALAWHWALLNEMAMDDLDGADGVRLLRYEDLCERPMEVARDLFAFAGIDMHAETERFLQQSISYEGKERYFQVFRNPLRSANKWREELSEDEIGRILEIVGQTRPGQLFVEDAAINRAARR